MSDYNNPCDGHKCRAGERCEPVFTPQLMQLPVAHCISINKDSDSECVCVVHCVCTLCTIQVLVSSTMSIPTCSAVRQQSSGGRLEAINAS